MANIFIGALVTAIFLWVVSFSKKRRLHINWWQWTLTTLEFLYITFVLAMIVSFLEEGAPRAAVVMGLVFGFAAVVGAVLLARFVFNPKRSIDAQG